MHGIDHPDPLPAAELTLAGPPGAEAQLQRQLLVIPVYSTNRDALQAAPITQGARA
ncbi:hypothetical protein [Streptomyces murinus]|uniref:hypothetical protein n=1 Tax=Streptomyces murinus TaxID=33900 RepID=UPI003817FF76